MRWATVDRSITMDIDFEVLAATRSNSKCTALLGGGGRSAVPVSIATTKLKVLPRYRQMGEAGRCSYIKEEKRFGAGCAGRLARRFGFGQRGQGWSCGGKWHGILCLPFGCA